MAEWGPRTSAETNTRFICVWAINDGDYYGWLQTVAQEARDANDYLILKDAVIAIFEAGSTDAVRATAREMSEDDMDTVDWAEVASDLIDE